MSSLDQEPKSKGFTSAIIAEQLALPCCTSNRNCQNKYQEEGQICRKDTWGEKIENYHWLSRVYLLCSGWLLRQSTVASSQFLQHQECTHEILLRQIFCLKTMTYARQMRCQKKRHTAEPYTCLSVTTMTASQKGQSWLSNIGTFYGTWDCKQNSIINHIWIAVEYNILNHFLGMSSKMQNLYSDEL